MRRPVTSWPFSLTTVALAAGTTTFLAAQTPTPPRPLPPSITGATPTPPPVSPASGVQAQTTSAPVARFQNLRDFPPETVQAVYTVWAGANWLSRMNQANGRFLPGLNPALRTPLPADPDLRQAVAALALAEAAQFTGKEEFAARATQAVLTLMSLTKPDPADASRRVPDAPSERCNRVGFAAVLALAVYALPSPDPKLLTQAEELDAFLRSRCGADGSIQTCDQPGDAAKADPDGVDVYPGLAVQALAAANRAKPEAGRQAVIAKAVGYYRGVFKVRPTAMLAATLLPGFADHCLQTKDATVAAAVGELADWLCGCQYTAADAAAAWVGGFRPGQLPAQTAAEPGSEGATCAAALAAAIPVIRQVAPDLTRFRRYRQAAVDGLAFARRLQFSDENADHFEKGFRARFLVGGVHLSPSDGTLRIDATAHLVTAHLAFLRSGAEGNQD